MGRIILKTFLTAIVIFLLLSFSTYSQDAVYLDSIGGFEPETGGVVADFPLAFKFNFRIESHSLLGFTNGKRMYSPDGAEWEPPTQVNNDFMFSAGLLFTNYFSVDGIGSDTIGFGGFVGSVKAEEIYDGYCTDYKTTYNYDRTQVPNRAISTYLDGLTPNASVIKLNEIKLDQYACKRQIFRDCC